VGDIAGSVGFIEPSFRAVHPAEGWPVPLGDGSAGRVTLQPVEIRLPLSGRCYYIQVPTESSRDELFQVARGGAAQPKPFWSRLWASGVAMADVVLASRDEMTGRPILELGCGLGVTATALLEIGADLTVSDYSDEALSICHVNTLNNAGRSPRPLCLNWRAPDPQVLMRARIPGGYPIIVAADVLYESVDIAPLFALIDQLLAPHGCLWLAEPGRKTARRFLHTVAEAGWQGSTIYADGPWPNDGIDHIAIHFLQRPLEIDRLVSGLGGWRL
jgi:predicted nicotinamide N-methyase